MLKPKVIANLHATSHIQNRCPQFKPRTLKYNRTIMYNYKDLRLKYGDIIYIQNEIGEGITGTFEDEYDSSNETFKFNNHSNGIIEVIRIKHLQFITKVI